MYVSLLNHIETSYMYKQYLTNIEYNSNCLFQGTWLLSHQLLPTCQDCFINDTSIVVQASSKTEVKGHLQQTKGKKIHNIYAYPELFYRTTLINNDLLLMLEQEMDKSFLCGHKNFSHTFYYCIGGS